MRRRQWWTWAMVAVVGAAIAAFVLLALLDDDRQESTSSSTTATSAASSTSSVVVTTTTSAPASTSTMANGLVPGQVAVVDVVPPGGSGEIEIHWDAVASASGYRVERAASPDGPFSVSADVNVTTGEIVVASGVTNVFSDQQSYFPSSSSASVVGPPPSELHYVELADGRRYLRVTAYNDEGAGPPSIVVCAAPFGSPSC